jgi:hypothetical protein
LERTVTQIFSKAQLIQFDYFLIVDGYKIKFTELSPENNTCFRIWTKFLGFTGKPKIA